MREKRVCLAQFAGAHGVRGEAKLRCFTESAESVAAYGPLTSEDGKRRFTFTFLRSPKPGLAIVRAPEIASREDAAALSGVKLFAPRAALPKVEDDDEFYIEDLVGLEARTLSGRALGRIAAVHNFGAGDLLEVKQGKSVILLPFTLTAVPKVDLSAAVVLIADAALEEIDATAPQADPQFVDDTMREEDA